MAKPIENWADAYSPESFAEKHGLMIEQAKVVISSNGPSRHGCDVGAIAFKLALDMRNKSAAASRHRRGLED